MSRSSSTLFFWRILKGSQDEPGEQTRKELIACFRAGMVLDGLEEPVFNHPLDGSEPRRLLSWTNHREIPPALVARLRLPS